MYKIEFRRRDTVTPVLLETTPIETRKEARVFAMAWVRKAYCSHRVSFRNISNGVDEAYWGTECLGVVVITKD